jgi:hypothetical protein
MAATVSHTFVSAIADDSSAAAAGMVLPSHWNATHTVSVALDDLSDVSAVSPTTGQTLMYDGSEWSPQSGAYAGAAGRAFYLCNTTASDIAGYMDAPETVNPAHSQTSIVTGNTGTGWTLNEEFATQLGQPNVEVFPSGNIYCHIHAATGAANEIAQLKMELYSRTSGGTETLIGTATSGSFLGATPQELVFMTTNLSPVVLSATDRLVFKIYSARVSGPTTVTTTVYFEGADTAGFVLTPIVSAGTVAASSVTFDPAAGIAATNVQDAIEEVKASIPTDPGTTSGVGTYLVSGATISWDSNLVYRVGAATYYLDGVLTTSTEQTVTLTAADGTNDRIDVLVLDGSGVLDSVDGTASADPAEPTIDPAVYLKLGIVLVEAGTTAPALTETNIYTENAEWAGTASAGTIVTNGTTNPRTGTYVVDGTNVAANAYVNFVKPASGTVDLSTQASLVMFVRVKAAFPTNKAFRLSWYSGTSLRGTQVTVGNGQYGFNSATTGSYQQIVVPISAFAVPVGVLVTTLRVTVVGSGANVGFYLDDIVLVAGATSIPTLTASRAIVSDTSGNLAASTVTSTEVGYLSGVTSAIQTQLNTKSDGSIPQNSQSAAYTLVIGDANKHIYHPSSDNNARTYTIPANSSVAFAIGTAITFVNEINTVTIAITTDTLTLAGTGTTGSRTLAANGIATALKVASTKWVISGTGLT